MFSVLNSQPVNSNLSQGPYRSRFFELTNYQLSRMEFNNHLYKDEEVERTLLLQEFSFAFLREDKLRTIMAYYSEGKKIEFADFLNYFSLSINSSNIYKTGKYLSRVFRPTRYGLFFKGLDIHVNNNPVTLAKNTDGISLISLELAKSLGWNNAKVNNSAQFTILYKGGLIKGNCIVSDKIEHDVIIYESENIKKDISLTNDAAYVSLEPLKLSDSLRIDIQTVLNLWPLFGGEQYLSWTYTGIQQFKKDLMSGNLITWFSDEDIDEESETWTLKKAIYSGIDYRRFPGLLRQAWNMFRKSLIRYAYEKNGELNLRIPVPGGLRGYIRVDLRNHDGDGNFSPLTEKGIVTLDDLGNLWVNEDDITEFMQIKGGADQDDNIAIIPVEEDKAVIYRNPNQYGEYGIHKIKYEGINIGAINKTFSEIPYKQSNRDEKESDDLNKITGNNLLDRFLSALPVVAEEKVEYKVSTLLKTYNHIKESNSSIGLAANAEMILSAIRISNPSLAKELTNIYSWNLETIIDSQVKDGISADEDMNAVQNLLEHIYYTRIPVPKNLFTRFPEKMRDDLQGEKSHPFDELIDAIKYLINKTDIEVLGKGSVRKGNRIPGLIDKLDIPVVELGLHNLDNTMNNIAGDFLSRYNRSVAIMLEKTKALPEIEKEKVRTEELETIQLNLLNKLQDFSQEDRGILVKAWAYNIYSTERAPHDSILWIGDKDAGIKGTAGDTLNMLKAVMTRTCSPEDCDQIIKLNNKTNLNIRLWSKTELDVISYRSASEILIMDGHALLGNEILYIGQECRVQDGIYKVRSVIQSRSKKNKDTCLRNSITLSVAL